jgi:Cof subfamily protein (haloacid dehalogenase superfamily)
VSRSTNGRFRLVAIDLDGSLVGRENRVSERNRRAIAAARAAGVLVTVATGRRFVRAQPVLEQIGVSVPVILNNGALVKDSRSGRILHDVHLPRAMALQAVGIVAGAGLQPVVYENAFLGDHIHTGPAERDQGVTQRYLERNQEQVIRHETYDFPLTADPLSVGVLDTPERVTPLLTRLAPPVWTTTRSDSTLGEGALYFEVLAPGTSKRMAIAHLARHLGVDLTHVLAIGDNFNDLEMLQGVGLGVAMGNAPEPVKAAAGAVTARCEEDGVALAIERYVLSASPLPLGED